MTNDLIDEIPMPRKAFTQLSDAFVYYTDCQVATFFDYVGRKSQSKSSVDRQKGITQGMIYELQALPDSPQKDAVLDRYRRAMAQYHVYFQSKL